MNKKSEVSNIIRGCWQLACGHSQQKTDIQPIINAIDCGFDTFDCADIYLGVEELIGQAAKAAGKKVYVHTKFVPDLDVLQHIDQKYIENIIDRSRRRLEVECIDLVQFHWWDWNVKNYLPAMKILSHLKDLGKIAKIGLTNVNKVYLEEFTTHFEVASLQVQGSLFDKRLERGLKEFCRNMNIKIYAYGSLLGGFLHKNWLNRPEPSLEQLQNRSLVKYKLLIDSACGWKEFQRRLLILNKLAEKYHSDIGCIAIAAFLQAGCADAVIVGLSPRNYAAQNQSLALLPQLEAHELQELHAWACNLAGDPYDEERDITKAHAKVMKYNLNARKINEKKSPF